MACLRESHKLNPFVGEPCIVLAQCLIVADQFESAEAMADKGLQLLCEWGMAWDKRMSWEAWVAWVRILKARAAARQPWPKTSWEVVNFGLVPGV
mmetsp:Transcript_14247/g.30934  ORF Transcript_14247/g.30934 Transcript_14247/m.30934 type:complete len:95 (+) Transcript_14247:369-653(+)